jgi:pimeloyl-ACP methyl ester carboxylesterase
MQAVQEELTFFDDDGNSLIGDLYSASSEPVAAIGFCPGFGGTRGSLPTRALAPALAAKYNLAVLAFDYSGFGASEGRPNHLDPVRRVWETRAAVSQLIVRYPGLATRIGLLGISFGAPIAVSAAAADHRVGALVAMSGFASGSRWMRELRPHWKWVEYTEQIASDALVRVASGKSGLVDSDWIMPRDPDSITFVERNFNLDIVSAQRICEFEPVRDAARLRGKPSLFIHTKRDLLIPWQHSADLAEAAAGHLILIEGHGHYDLYSGEPLNEAVSAAGTWYMDHLVGGDLGRVGI